MLDNCLEVLDEREKRVIKNAIWFRNSDQYTLDEMGKTFGLTLERIRQIEKAAINKIRESEIGKQLIA